MNALNSNSKSRLWSSYILQGVIIVMLMFGGINNLLQTEMAVNGAIEMGYPSSSLFYLGIILITSTILFAVPKTSILGALFIQAWLGGAVATHMIHNDPLSMVLFPIIFGTLVWFSIWLRNEKIRQLIPFA